MIQKKIKDACVVKEAKVDVLVNQWEKIFGII